jgi:glutamyl-tRNA reductase
MSDPVHIVVLGLNHNTAPLNVRERLYVSEEGVPGIVTDLKGAGIEETVLLSTCNRTEVYFQCERWDEASSKVAEVITEHFGVDRRELAGYTYVLVDQEAYRHLFLVASGLDSMVIGEPQILGQVKDAYRIAAHNNATGFFLDRTFHRTFNVAKRVRTETRVGYNPLSISSMAVELGKQIFGDLAQKRILVMGAGEMCEIALKHFRKEGLTEVLITNRTFQAAQKLAQEFRGVPCPFQDLPELLVRVDLVLSSTGSPQPLITREIVVAAMKKRKGRPLFFIDIAVPRDVDPAINDLENVYLYDIDDLKELSQRHLGDRLKESEKGRTIVEEEVTKFSLWLQQLDMNPLIARIYETTEAIRTAELKKAVKRLKGADEEMLKHVDLLTKGITNKLIHRHVAFLREKGNPAVVEIMKGIFHSGDEDEKEMDPGNEGE